MNHGPTIEACVKAASKCINTTSPADLDYDVGFASAKRDILAALRAQRDALLEACQLAEHHIHMSGSNNIGNVRTIKALRAAIARAEGGGA